MLTLISYVCLKYLLGTDWSGWVLVLPVMLDLSIISKIDNWINK